MLPVSAAKGSSLGFLLLFLEHSLSNAMAAVNQYRKTPWSINKQKQQKTKAVAFPVAIWGWNCMCENIAVMYYNDMYKFQSKHIKSRLCGTYLLPILNYYWKPKKDLFDSLTGLFW